MTDIELKDRLKKHAEEQGFDLCEGSHLDNIIRGMRKREEKYGLLICPCRIPTPDKELNMKMVCPCAFHPQEIEEDGECKCGLFLRKRA